MIYRQILFQFLGGLGLFLFSIKYMGDGLQLSAGEKLRYILDKYTTNPFLGVLTGIFVTILIQSSSGTTVITVGLVGAGLLTLRQAIGIIMGANIGTTLTTFIIGFNLSKYALPIIFIGAALLFFTKKQFLNNMGRILYGFGGIFYALSLMAAAMSPLKSEPWFTDLMLKLGNNSILGVFIGTVLTMLIQASSATISILQNLYADNLITLKATLPVLFGDNIGTTITAILACIGASTASKRVALTHVLFNIIGTIIFLIFLAPFTKFTMLIQTFFSLPPKMTIAFAHGFFNVANTIIQFPFIAGLAYIVTKIFPITEEEITYKPEYLDALLIHKAPSVALGQSKKEIGVMLTKANRNFDLASEFFQTRQEKLSSKIERKEEELNQLDQEITKYITQIFREHLSVKEGEIGSALLDITRDIERIGDHAFGIVKDVNYQIKKSLIFSDYAKSEVLVLSKITKEMLSLTYEALIENDKIKAIEALDYHNRIYEYEKKVRKKHISRMNEGECQITAGLYYVDTISHFTRICDHARNIVEKVINDQL
ncbi:Na/Pi cotransporter family protein [Caviibacter abscessus]|uniref:Na/Pi cotransporter family protein n=1 Tax=Caviibacter abscessus TaxID=1766719 RepID=UPI00082A0598|nr:Na/Pi cotransporter family protein [Caviibacter abscessus]